MIAQGCRTSPERIILKFLTNLQLVRNVPGESPEILTCNYIALLYR